MKIGIITDVHNNCEALNAVLVKFASVGVEKIICCGDILGIGPKPEETVRKIMQLDNIECVRGNHDNYLINGIPTEIPNDEMMEYGEIEHHKWEHRQLSKESVCFIKSLPFTKTLTIGNKKIYIAHFSIGSDNKYNYYTPTPSLDDLKIMFQNVEADIIIYGHNHNPSVYNESDKWYINCGSLGCPIGTSNCARAGILDIDNKNIYYEQLNVPYDVNKVINEIKSKQYPDYKNILHHFYGVCAK